MRNLKRVLALVLALTMVLSFAISASAGAFTDVQDDDDYASAINLLASLEVLKGFEDGTYNSAGSYTREQFAKILYVLVNGKDDNAAMYQGTAPFPDVAADRWSAGYITWAVNLGICNGRDDGNFWPTDIVKYAEACKMFLIAMGYSSTMYTYPYGFIDKAQTLKMFDDVKGYSTFGEANRGTVAQMAYNALFAEAPRFGTYTTKEGDATTTDVALLIMGAFGVGYQYELLSGTSTNAFGTPVYDDDQVVLDATVYEYAGDVDNLIGTSVKVWSKEDDDAVGDRVIYLIEDSGKDKVYTVNPADIDEDNSDGDLLRWKDNGVNRKLEAAEGGWDFRDWHGGDVAGLDDPTDMFASVDDTAKSRTYRVIDRDGDGTADVIYVSYPQFGKVTALSSSKVSISRLSGETLLSGSKDIEETFITLAEDVEKNDYVLVNPREAVVDGSCEDVYDVVKAEAVSEVKYNKKSNEDVFFGGVNYEALDVAGATEIGKVYNIYLNANGYIAKAVEVEDDEVGNWLLVTASYTSVSDQDSVDEVRLVGYTADGTKKSFYVNLDDTDSVDDVWDADTYTWLPGTWTVVSYTLDDDGLIDSFDDANVLLNVDPDSMVGIGGAEYDDDKTQLTASGDAAKAFVTSSSVVYNVYTDNGTAKVAVLKDTDLPAFDNDEGKTAVMLTDSGEVSATVIYSGTTKLGATSDKYGLVISAVKHTVEDDSSKIYYELTVAIDGEIKTVETKNIAKEADPSDDNFDGITEAAETMFGYVKLVFNSAGKVTDADPIPGGADQYEVFASRAVSAIPNTKGFESFNVDVTDPVGDDDPTTVVTSAVDDLRVAVYGDDVAFYTIDAAPTEAGVAGVDEDDTVSATDKDSLVASTIDNKDDKTDIAADDSIYVVDFIENDKDEVIAVFIYTTPCEVE